jgi:hypothetical protein
MPKEDTPNCAVAWMMSKTEKELQYSEDAQMKGLQLDAEKSCCWWIYIQRRW